MRGGKGISYISRLSTARIWRFCGYLMLTVVPYPHYNVSCNDACMRYHPKNLRLDEQGVSKVLGALEAEVMNAVWTRGDATVRDVRETLQARKAHSFNTIMTIMNRLVDKGLLAKRRQGSAYAYRAKVGKEAFCRDVTRSVVSALVSDGSFFQIAAFAEALQDCSDEDLAALREVLTAKE